MRHIYIHSLRFGVRKNCSFFIVRPPVGCFLSGFEGDSDSASDSDSLCKQIALSELAAADSSVSKNQERKRRNPLKDFYSGNDHLNHELIWGLRLSDQAIKEWIDGSEDGCVTIELYSYMLSPLLKSSFLHGNPPEPRH